MLPSIAINYSNSKGDIVKMKKRWKEAQLYPCKAFLFDIDHNLGDKKGHVSEFIINELVKLTVEKKIIVGFVSGRPEKVEENQMKEGKEIMVVVNEIIKRVPFELHKYIVIFPEHAGYGKNIGTDELYDFGFSKLMSNFPLESLKAYAMGLKWFSRIHKKYTGLSIWAKEECQNKSTIEEGILFIKEWAMKQNLGDKINILNGADRTVDILFKEVNKSRAVVTVSKIFNIQMDEIATSDDQASYGQTGYELTNKTLGFATNEFESEIINTKQVSTLLAFNKVKIEANLHLFNSLNFVSAY